MAGTYSQMHIQVVFAVSGRHNLIDKPWKEDLNKYVAGIIKGKGHKSIIVNGMPDHIHAFLGLKPAVAISDLVRDIKNNSSKFINQRKYITGKFSWQEGYGVFSYSHSHISQVYNYILNQEEHHQKRTFRQEYLGLLKKFEIEYDEIIYLNGLKFNFTPAGFVIHFDLNVIIVSPLRGYNPLIRLREE